MKRRANWWQTACMDANKTSGDPEVRAIQELFPPGCAVAWSDKPGSMDDPLLPAEQWSTPEMVPARLASFCQGRACARRALAQLGHPMTAVPVGEQRAPLWPPGITGSIAHCAGRAAAVAARQEVALAVGIDLELPGQLEPDVVALVCTPAERDWLDAPEHRHYARVLFAIKESVYKCLWPLNRRFIDFQEVQIELDTDLGRYSVQPGQAGPGPVFSSAIQGGWNEAGGLICASAYLPSAPAR